MRVLLLLFTAWCLLVVTGCRPEMTGSIAQHAEQKASSVPSPAVPRDTSLLEQVLIRKGLVNVSMLDSSIHVTLHYSTTENFLNRPMYHGLERCYLPCEVAIKLCNAQYYLKQRFPLYSLIVFDAVRPLHIQQEMWDSLDMPASQKINYVAHPGDLSLHNYGAAVDLGIISEEGVLLDMGSGFDSFDSLSQPKLEPYFLKTGRLREAAYYNRKLLRDVMQRAGFTGITSEWWHFNATNKAAASVKYVLIE